MPEPDSPSSSVDPIEHREPSKGVFAWGFALVVLLGYPLSSGPVIFLWEKFNLEGTAAAGPIRAFFFPLRLALDWSNNGLITESLLRWELFWTDLAR